MNIKCYVEKKFAAPEPEDHERKKKTLKSKIKGSTSKPSSDSKPNISYPTNFEHTVHVGFDAITGEFTVSNELFFFMRRPDMYGFTCNSYVSFTSNYINNWFVHILYTYTHTQNHYGIIIHHKFTHSKQCNKRRKKWTYQKETTKKRNDMKLKMLPKIATSFFFTLPTHNWQPLFHSHSEIQPSSHDYRSLFFFAF